MKYLLTVLIFLLLSLSAFFYKNDEIYKITLLHTNDHHGRFFKSKKGEYGMSARKTLIDKIRAEVKLAGGHILLLSGGDINTGVPTSDLQDAEPDFIGMNKIGYDAMAVGNHEFDKPLVVLRKQQGWAKFPFLSANIYSKKTRKRMFKPYIIKQIGELKVGILGLTTESSSQKYLEDEQVEFRLPVNEAKKILPVLDSKTDLIIGLTHMGHYRGHPTLEDTTGDIYLARNTKGFDIIVGGHSQNPLFKPDRENGVLIVQAQEWGKYVGRMDLEVKNGNLKILKYELIPVNLLNKNGEFNKDTKLSENENLLKLLQPFQEKAQKILKVKIGNTKDHFIGSRNTVRFMEAPIGNLIGLAQRKRTGADISFIVGGGIRSDIEPGDITYESVLRVHPFGNTIVTVEVTRSELELLMSDLVQKNHVGTGQFPQLTGVKLYRLCEGTRKCKLKKIKVEGKKNTPEQKYKIVTNSYLAGLKFGSIILKNLSTYIDTGHTDAAVLKDYISNKNELDLSDYIDLDGADIIDL